MHKEERVGDEFLHARMPLARQIFSAPVDNPFPRMPDPIQNTIMESELRRSRYCIYL